MQVADHRPEFVDRLSVQGQDEPQDTVRRRVLRAHVDDHALVERPVVSLRCRDDLVPVLAADVIDAALVVRAVSVGLVISRSGHSYDLRSSGGGIVAPRYSTGIPPSG